MKMIETTPAQTERLVVVLTYGPTYPGGPTGWSWTVHDVSGTLDYPCAANVVLRSGATPHLTRWGARWKAARMIRWMRYERTRTYEVKA